MPLSRRFALALLVASCAFSTALAQGPLTCTANAGVPPPMRIEGRAEPAGDIIIDCTGGTPVAAGQPLPSFNLQLFLNTNVTSRILLAGAQTWTEALLLIDEPQPGNQRPCLDASGTCAVLSGAVGPNVFQGQLAGSNSIVFSSIPFNPPGAGAHRYLRIVNLRVNASELTYSPPALPPNSEASLSISGGAGIQLQNSQVTVGWAIPGATAEVYGLLGSVISQPVPVSVCSAASTLRFADLGFREWVPSFFRGRIVDSPERQDIPGRVYNTESMFNPVLPSGAVNRNLALAGVADSGTRVRARFTNVPAGVTLRVATVSVTRTENGPVPSLRPKPQATLLGQSADVIVNGVPTAPVSLAGGAGEAVWEVTDSTLGSWDTLLFPLYVSYAAGGPASGTAFVSMGYAPVSSVAVASETEPLPRFSESPYAPIALFAVSNSCACQYTLSRSAADAPSTISGSTFFVTSAIGCPWTATSNVPWITITRGASGNGDGAVAFRVETTSEPLGRTGTISVAGRTFTVTQAGVNCTYTVTPARLDVSYSSTSGLLSVTTQAGCPWSAAGLDSWVTVPDPTIGSGSSTVPYQIKVNPGSSTRSGSILVAGNYVWVTQAGFLNDEPAGATVISTLPYQATHDTSPATGNGNDPVHSCGSATRDSATVWFRYVAPFTGTLRVSTLGSSYNTVLTAYSGSNSPGPELACNDDFTGQTSRIDLPVSLGQPYLIEVSGYGPSSTGGSLALSVMALPRTIDVNRDGKSDILWQHPTNGDVWWWALNGAAVHGYGFTGWNADYRIAVSGDFNADNYTDIIVQHPLTGAAYVWYLNYGAYSSYAAISGPTAWRIVGASDFNGDGKPDLLWQLPGSSQGWVWFMNGATYAGGQPVLGSATYRVAATGDLNGDGYADIVWQHPANRDVWIWYMNGVTYQSSVQLTGVMTYDIAGAGDYNGDGHLDLLWQHPTNRDVWTWSLVNSVYSASTAITGPMTYKVYGWR